jgi:copper(I)-binding protein
MKRHLSLAFAGAALACGVALAQPAPTVAVSNVWARATPPSAATAAIYMTLTSPADDRLTGASTPVAGVAHVHEMTMEGTVMRMREIEGGLELPAGKAVSLQPGGYHLMLEHLKGPLQPGESVPVHLTFAHAPPIDVTAQVQPIGATRPAAAAHASHAEMPGMNMGK